ncbi:MAG: nucleotidyltransferase family protein [Jatrophihabitantaceae bacterium]
MRLYEVPQGALRALLRARPVKSVIAANRVLKTWDWQGLADDANGHNVGVLIYQRLTEAGQLDAVPDEVAAAWLADARHAALQHGLQLRDALAVSAEFEREGIRHAFVKGLAYAVSLYEPRWVRFGGDVDVLVDRENIERVRTLMKKFYFTQAKFSPDHQKFWTASPEEIRAVENQHYELAEFNKWVELLDPPEWLLTEPFVPRSPFGFGWRSDKPFFCSSIDVHWALHFLFADSGPLDEVRQTDAGIPVLSPEWSLIYSIFKLYVEAFDRPRFGFTHVSDIVSLLATDIVDWNKVDQLVQQHGLEAAAYYTLASCQALAGTATVPEQFMQRWSAIAPPDDQQSSRLPIDFGDFVPYLAGDRSVRSLGAPQQSTVRSKRS